MQGDNMGSIPLPALGVRPPEQPANPMDQYAKAVQLKSLMQAQQMQQQDMQIKQQQIKDQQAHTAAMNQWDGKDPEEIPKLILKNGGSGDAAMSMKKSILGQKVQYSQMAKDDAETGSKNIETLQKKHDMTAGAI